MSLATYIGVNGLLTRTWLHLNSSLNFYVGQIQDPVRRIHRRRNRKHCETASKSSYNSRGVINGIHDGEVPSPPTHIFSKKHSVTWSTCTIPKGNLYEWAGGILY